MRKLNSIFLLAVFFLCLTGGAAASTPPPPAKPANYVVDLAGVINARTRQQLDSLLHALEQKTGAQVVILTVKSLDGEDINGFSMRTAEQWKLGQKGKDNGVLFTVAMQERKYRFEVGYGLESILPDSLVGTIGRRTLVPYFKKGKYSKGIAAAAGVIVKIISKANNVQLAGVDRLPQPITRNKVNPFAIEFFVLLVLFFILLGSRRRRSRLGALGAAPFIMGGWSGGGGFGGGGFGGFGGGGGGGFGGGGASGGW